MQTNRKQMQTAQKYISFHGREDCEAEFHAAKAKLPRQRHGAQKSRPIHLISDG